MADPDPIDILHKAWEAKTPGPWSTMRGADGWDIDAPSGLVTMDSGMRGRDAAFIVIAEQLVGTLVERLRAAEAEVKRTCPECGAEIVREEHDNA